MPRQFYRASTVLYGREQQGEKASAQLADKTMKMMILDDHAGVRNMIRQTNPRAETAVQCRNQGNDYSTDGQACRLN